MQLITEKTQLKIDRSLLKGRRNLTAAEIEILKTNGNRNSDASWNNVFVSAENGAFNPELISDCEIKGFLVVGRLRNAALKFHDLELDCGLYNSFIEDSVIGDDCVVRNVAWLKNYHISSQVMLFNIQEMSCTSHSKFGAGLLKEGEPESNRIWVGIGNENDGRSVLPFENMITADAFLWSRYREDKQLQKRFVELTEFGQPNTNDTFGIVEENTVIKNCTLLKDVKVGSGAYIKGAFKIKNVTLLSSIEEETQIGEGVELVNGIIGCGSRIFYQAVAVRFVIGRNCQLKYGARLLNSVLGDNSTVSCCELLNNLIFPFHEQHHNSSFLIASTVCGQSNIASGATIGSNHNSRSPDGEMFAGRGFWPGLCSDFKHNSRFASFVLVSKGSYQSELNVKYPFSLVASDGVGKPVHVIPAFWFLYNMYAITRNKSKFKKRDKRKIKVQHIETDPLAPDTIQEVLEAVQQLITLTARYLKKNNHPKIAGLNDENKIYYAAKDFLHQNPQEDFILEDGGVQRKYGGLIYKPVKAYKEYRKIIKYFAVQSLIEYCKEKNMESLCQLEVEKLQQFPLFTKWINAGGQIIPEEKIEELFALIKSRDIRNWEEVHAYYDKMQSMYTQYKATYAIYLLERLYSRPIHEFSAKEYKNVLADVTEVSNEMYDSAFSSRKKDYEDFWRTITFRNKEELESVVGSMEHNDFLKELKPETEQFNSDLKKIFADLC